MNLIVHFIQVIVFLWNFTEESILVNILLFGIISRIMIKFTGTILVSYLCYVASLGRDLKAVVNQLRLALN